MPKVLRADEPPTGGCGLVRSGCEAETRPLMSPPPVLEMGPPGSALDAGPAGAPPSPVMRESARRRRGISGVGRWVGFRAITVQRTQAVREGPQPEVPSHCGDHLGPFSISFRLGVADGQVHVGVAADRLGVPGFGHLGPGFRATHQH